MKIQFRELFALLALVTASTTVASREIVEKDISILQAIKIGSMLTGSAKLTAPLIGVYDNDGLVVGTIVGWTTDSEGQLHALLTQRGTTQALPSLLRELGIEVKQDHGPTILTISLGEACEPCKAMDSGVSHVADAISDTAVVRLTVNTSQPR